MFDNRIIVRISYEAFVMRTDYNIAQLSGGSGTLSASMFQMGTTEWRSAMTRFDDAEVGLVVSREEEDLVQIP